MQSIVQPRDCKNPDNVKHRAREEHTFIYLFISLFTYLNVNSYLVDSDINMGVPNYFSSSYLPCFSGSFHLPIFPALLATLGLSPRLV